MRYLGGKSRQAKHIVAAVESLYPDFEVYVEPFCGSMWSAVAMMERFPGRRYVMNDNHDALITFWNAVLAGWDPPASVTEKDWEYYKRTRDPDDPMTAYVGYGWSFAGRFFGTLARRDGIITGSEKSTAHKIRVIREQDVSFTCQDYTEVIPAEANTVVYLDPPYVGRSMRRKEEEKFDDRRYVEYAESILDFADLVIATDFNRRAGWKVLHNFGDTINVHNPVQRVPVGPSTHELLMQVRSKEAARNKSWPEGVPQGVPQPCASCSQMVWLVYQVSDLTWKRVVPADLRETHLCLSCFDSMLARRGLIAGDVIHEMWIIGQEYTMAISPEDVYMWDDYDL